MDDLYADLLGDEVTDMDAAGFNVAPVSPPATQLKLEAAEKQAEQYKLLVCQHPLVYHAHHLPYARLF
jgi:hypothetical protein